MPIINFFHLNALDSESLLSLLELRQTVFILEQNCLYADIDQEDKTAIHGVLKIENQLAGGLRILPPKNIGDNVWIGRFALHPHVRKKDLGKQLLIIVVNISRRLILKYPLRLRLRAIIKLLALKPAQLLMMKMALCISPWKRQQQTSHYHGGDINPCR